MAPRNTISRLTSRIDDLTERSSRGVTTVSGGSAAECQQRLEEMRAAGKPIMRHVRFIIIDTSGN